MKRYDCVDGEMTDCFADGAYILFEDHEAALAEAVKKEREACAQLVHSLSSQLYDECHQAALTLRARSDKP